MKVLICTDNGATAEETSAKALQFAKMMQAEMALLTVIDTQFIMTEGGITPQELIESSKAEQTENLEMLKQKVFANEKVWTFIEIGNVYETILKTAEEWKADIIMLGTHGRKGIQHAILGSVAEKVTRHSHIPVLIIPVK